MIIKFEKKMKGWMILDWKAKMKRKINFIKKIKKEPLKKWGLNLKIK